MIYPIVAYGHQVLKKEAEEIHEGEDVSGLISDMFETMGKANGVGLAAPQINKGIRLFVLDSNLMLDEEDDEKGIRKAFINPIILDEYGDKYTFEEGCLSIPEVRAEITRPEKLTIEYFDENWNLKGKLVDISKGKVSTDYRMLYP